MPTTFTKMTVDEFFDYAAELKGRMRRELIDGEVHEMSPAGFQHGDIGGRLAYFIGQCVIENDLGVMLCAETGFVLDPDPSRATVRAPDLAFIRKDRIEKPLSRKFGAIAPDFCAEVLSPSDRIGEVDQKITGWLEFGVKLVWVVDSDRRTVTAYTPDGEFKIFRENDVIDGGNVLPGFELAVERLFC